MIRRWLQRDDSGLLRHGGLLMLGTVVGAACNAGFHMVVGRTLSAAEYGSLVAMLGIILAATTPMLAVQNTLAHYISSLLQQSRRDALPALLKHWAILFAILSFAVAVGGVVLSQPVSSLWPGVPPALVAATFVVLGASLWMYYFYGLLQGTQSFASLAWIPQAWGGTRLLLGGLLTWWISSTALAALVAQGAGVAVVIGLSVLVLAAMRLPSSAEPPRAPEPGVYRYLGASLLCLAGYAMLMNLDTTLARRTFDPDTAGLFAKAATIARTAVFLPMPIATALFPKVTSRGDASPESTRLLLRAVSALGVIVAAVVAGCWLLPGVPWTILYGRWTPAEAALAARLTRAMTLAMSPLALVFLLMNFEMAQRRFRWALGLVPCGILYVVAVTLRHDRLLHIPLWLGVCNSLALILLLTAIRRQFRRTQA